MTMTKAHALNIFWRLFACELLLFIVAVNLLVSTTNAELPKGSLHGHLTFNEVNHWVEDYIIKSFPEIASFKEFGKSVEGRPLLVLCLGFACKLNDNKFTGGEVLYNGLHHAREPLGMMAIAAFADDMLTKFKLGDLTIKYLLTTRKLYFIFVVNPDGYVANENGSGMRRKNLGQRTGDKCNAIRQSSDNEIGVDLNRNYDFCFNQDDVGASRNPCAIDYEGPFPFSEPETIAMKRFIETTNIKVAFNYHSFGKEVYIPFSCKPKGFTKDEPFFRKYAARLTKANRYHYGQPWNEGLYSVNGDAADWMYATKNIYAVSPEVSPADPVASEHDGFWIPPDSVPSAAKETLEMNYVGAWTSGPYLELVTDVPEQIYVQENEEDGDRLMLRINVMNWGLLPTTGELVGVVAVTTEAREVFRTQVLGFGEAELKYRGENYVQGNVVLMKELPTNAKETVCVKDLVGCICYDFTRPADMKTLPQPQSLFFKYRIDPKDPPCAFAFEGIVVNKKSEAPTASLPPSTLNEPIPPVLRSSGSSVAVIILIVSISALCIMIVAYCVYQRYYRASILSSVAVGEKVSKATHKFQPIAAETDEFGDDELPETDDSQDDNKLQLA
jgi:hypothetical protein